MKFVELKKHLLSTSLCCYNLYGDDNFLITSSEKMFFNFVSKNNDFNKTVLSTENLTEKTLWNALNTTSFFGGAKVVLVYDLDCAKNKNLVTFVENYLKTNPNPNCVLVVVSDSPMFTEKVSSALKNVFCEVDCNRLDERMINAWICSELKKQNATMNMPAIQKLVEYTNGYLSKISLELNKLICYAGGRVITEADVDALVSKDLEFSVFELTESLGRGNSQKTFDILNVMMSDRKTAPSVFALIQNYFRRMFYSAVSAGTNAQIGAELGVKEFAIKKAKETASLFSKPVLKQIVDLCGELDYKIKTSQIDYENAVNYLVMFILTNNKK
jgi:DNA polymerase-3 subunit delta